jgi:hypothetical protein
MSLKCTEISVYKLTLSGMATTCQASMRTLVHAGARDFGQSIPSGKAENIDHTSKQKKVY